MFEEEDKKCNRKLQVMDQCMKRALFETLNVNWESVSNVESQPFD